MRNLVIFDLDDTLFTHDLSKLTIYERDSANNIISTLPYDEFLANGGVLVKIPDDHRWDFGDFECSEKFRESAQPVASMIQMLNAFATQADTKVEIVTARSDLKCKNTFIETMELHGIDILKDVHVTRTGCPAALKRDGVGYSTPLRKREAIFKMIQEDPDLRYVSMYDDSHPNLSAFLTLKDEFKHIVFSAYHVDVKKDVEVITRIS